jgi:hypothetical protein
MAGSTFALKTNWENWGTSRHFRVYLERRAPPKYGRLQAMHAIVPRGRRKDEADALFGSARYRRATLDATRELFRQAGVPEEQAEDFMRTITRKFPYPTAQESFDEQIGSPLLAMALGKRRAELSYHRTGVPELTEEAMAPVVDAFRTFPACPPPAIRAAFPAVSKLPSCHSAAQLWQLVKMPIPRYESQIVFYRHCGDPQIVIGHRRTGAFELHE